MPDLSVIAAGIQSVKTAIDITKELRAIDSSLKDAEVRLKLADLITSLSEAKIALTEANEENQHLRAEISNLLRQQDELDKVVFRDGHYYLVEPNETSAPGPFCSKCYSDDKKLIIVNEVKGGLRRLGKYVCPKCDSVSN